MRNGLSPTVAVSFVTLFFGSLPLTGFSAPGDVAPAASRETVARFLESGQPPLTAYRAKRHLEASTRGGKLTAQLDAWTDLNSDGTFTFQIIEESGSDLIRRKVLRQALVHEQQSRNGSQLDESALTVANYDFSVDEASADAELVKIALSPRRKSQTLISGAAFVTRDGADLVRVEGILSKRPSLWTTSVEVTRHYARIEGVRVPTEMQSRAELLLVGDSSFLMTYQYSTINGHALHEGF
jgi:hypothetical protein